MNEFKDLLALRLEKTDSVKTISNYRVYVYAPPFSGYSQVLDALSLINIPSNLPLNQNFHKNSGASNINPIFSVKIQPIDFFLKDGTKIYLSLHIFCSSLLPLSCYVPHNLPSIFFLNILRPWDFIPQFSSWLPLLSPKNTIICCTNWDFLPPYQSINSISPQTFHFIKEWLKSVANLFNFSLFFPLINSNENNIHLLHYLLAPKSNLLEFKHNDKYLATLLTPTTQWTWVPYSEDLTGSPPSGSRKSLWKQLCIDFRANVDIHIVDTEQPDPEVLVAMTKKQFISELVNESGHSESGSSEFPRTPSLKLLTTPSRSTPQLQQDTDIINLSDNSLDLDYNNLGLSPEPTRDDPSDFFSQLLTE